MCGKEDGEHEEDKKTGPLCSGFITSLVCVEENNTKFMLKLSRHFAQSESIVLSVSQTDWKRSWRSICL